MNKRAQKARETKQKILEVAEELAKEKGLDKLSVNDITKKCGIAHGTFYLYFKSVSDLATYFTRDIFERIRQEYENDPQFPVVQRLQRMLGRWYAFVEEYSLYYSQQSYRNFATEAVAGREIKPDSQMHLGIELLEDILTEAVAKGELVTHTPTGNLARLIVFTFEGSAMYYCRTDGEYDISEWAEYHMNYVFEELLKTYMAVG